MRRLIATLITVGALCALTISAAGAHNLEVSHPVTGEVITEQWVGGSTVPADADPMFGPFNLPPSHGSGLISTCQGTAASPAVDMKAPPFYTGCQHGQP